MRRWLCGVAAALACGLARAASSSPIPFKQDASAGAAALPGGALGVLLLSVAAIVAVLVIRKRLNLPQAGKHAPQLLRVLETQRLGPRTLLSVVEFAGGRYLIAQGEHGVSCLAAAPPATPPTAPLDLLEQP
jgi:flagellar biogenesis protein FliO